MTFDPKSLLTTPPVTVNDLSAKLDQIKALGMGGAGLRLPDGQFVVSIDLVAVGEVPAHFVLNGSK